MVKDYNFYDAFNLTNETWVYEAPPVTPSSLAWRNFHHVKAAQYKREHNPTKQIQFDSMCQKSIQLAQSCFGILHIESDPINGWGKIIIKFPTRWGSTTDEVGVNKTIAELLLLYPDFQMSIEDDFIVMQFNEDLCEEKLVNDYSRLLELLWECIFICTNINEESQWEPEEK